MTVSANDSALDKLFITELVSDDDAKIQLKHRDILLAILSTDSISLTDLGALKGTSRALRMLLSSPDINIFARAKLESWVSQLFVNGAPRITREKILKQARSIFPYFLRAPTADGGGAAAAASAGADQTNLGWFNELLDKKYGIAAGRTVEQFDNPNSGESYDKALQLLGHLAAANDGASAQKGSDSDGGSENDDADVRVAIMADLMAHNPSAAASTANLDDRFGEVTLQATRSHRLQVLPSKISTFGMLLFGIFAVVSYILFNKTSGVLSYLPSFGLGGLMIALGSYLVPRLIYALRLKRTVDDYQENEDMVRVAIEAARGPEKGTTLSPDEAAGTTARHFADDDAPSRPSGAEGKADESDSDGEDAPPSRARDLGRSLAAGALHNDERPGDLSPLLGSAARRP